MNEKSRPANAGRLKSDMERKMPRNVLEIVEKVFRYGKMKSLQKERADIWIF